MRPSGVTAVASMVSSAAPDSARCPRWITCQSVAHPSTAEYWHIGAITIRLRKLEPADAERREEFCLRHPPIQSQAAAITPA